MKSLILSVMLLFGLISAANIMGDQQNPIQLNPASSFPDKTNLVLKFSLPSNSNGLVFGQFIGVQFPADTGSTFKFDATTPVFSCGLTDSAGVTYTVTAAASMGNKIPSAAAFEQNIAYCRFSDYTNSVLKVGPSIIYTLTLGLGTTRPTSKYIRTVGLFTSTTNYPERIIIDSIPVLGKLGQYENIAGSSLTPPLGWAATPTRTISGGTSNTIFPYSVFDITFTLKVNTGALITAADTVIVFQYPSDTVSAATSIVTTAASTTGTAGALLKGTLALSQFSTGTSTSALALTGVGEDLSEGRNFVITLKGWKALDTTINKAKDFEVFVYYKNTYSVYSYITNNVFLVTPATLTLTANHPEFWDIWRNAAWPIKFTITPTFELSMGGYVTIQHTNAMDSTDPLTGNKLSFIASTCDFSDNDQGSFDNNFGKRPACFPMRTDLTYTGNTSTSTLHSGSGVFFYLKGPITTTKGVIVTVWAYADNCGGKAVDNAKITETTLGSTIPNTVTNYVTPQFTAYVYRTITATAMNESRFADGNRIGASQAASFNGKCWNNLVQTPTGTDLAVDRFANSWSTAVTGQTASPDYLMYREFTHNWEVSAFTTSTAIAAAATALVNVSTTFNAGYLYLGTSPSASSFAASYFLMRVAIIRNVSTGTDVFHQVFPTSILQPKTASTRWSGRLVAQFSSQWFQASSGLQYTSTTTTPCMLTWSLINDVGSYTALGTKTINYCNLQTSLGSIDTTSKNGFAAGSTGDLDSTNTYIGATPTLPTDATKIFRITGLPVSTTVLYKYFDDGGIVAGGNGADTTNCTASAANGTFYAGFFSSCLTWVQTAPTSIKTIYAYIDIQFRWEYTGSSATFPLRNARFIKLFPEAGVFQDIKKQVGSTAYTTVTGLPVYNHFGWGTSSTSNSVCLLELHGPSTVATSDSSSSVFVLHIAFGTLLETDYLDASAQYPVSNLAANVSVYGLQSTTPMTTAATGTIGNAQLDVHVPNGTTIGPATGGTATNIFLSKVEARNTGALGATKPTTSYQFYLGSTLVFSGITSNILATNVSSTSSVQNNIAIPYYCPLYKAATGPEYFHGALPIVSGNWMTMTSHSNVTSVNRFWGRYEATGTVFYNNIIPNLAAQAYVAATAVAKTPNAAVTPIAFAVLRWAGYYLASTATANDTILYIYNNDAAVVKCTAHWIFANSSITFDTAVTYGSSTAAGVNVNAKSFYAFGKNFAKSAFVGKIGGDATTPALATSTDVAVSTAVETAATYFVGVKRPTVDLLSVSGVLGAHDKVAYFCANAAAAEYYLLTNYKVDASGSNTVNNFIVDFNPQTTSATPWGTGSINYDKNEVLKNDIAANFKLTFIAPASIPIGAKFTITSNQLSAKSICGLVQSSGITSVARDCEVSGTSHICTVPHMSTTYSVCCYNVAMADAIGLTGLSISFPLNPSIVGLSTYITAEKQIIYNASNQITASNPYSWTTNQATASEYLAQPAKLSSVAYTNVAQDSGIGKAIFTITLPREPVRGGQIIVAGDFSGMIISGQIPRCLAVFSASAVTSAQAFGTGWDNGDALLDICLASTISSQAKSIVIQSKSIVYKCGASFSKQVLLMLWPVVVYNFTTSTNKYSVDMQNATSEPISQTGQSSLVASTTTFAAKPGMMGQWDTLCAVTSVVPKIPGEVADYTFSFDIDTNKSSLSNPNEVTIFFPYQYYGASIPGVMCYMGTTILNCSFTDDGILNVRFAQSILTNASKTVAVTVVGVVNPSIDSDISFPCTINSTTFATGVRLNQITGSGKLAGGIQITAATTRHGNLRFMAPATPVTDKNPRNLSTHTFRVAFDTAISLTALPTTALDGTPVFYVYFPSNYNLAWYNIISGTPTKTATVDVFSYNTTTGLIEKETTSPTVTTSASGNRITITFSAATYTVPAQFRYFEIKITNIQGPLDTTTQTSPATQTTLPYHITLTNAGLTYLYRTYTNLNSMSTDVIPVLSSSNTNNYLAYNRGNSFAFDNKKWVIDIVDRSSSGNPQALNTLNIKSGRYLQAAVQVKTNTATTMVPANAYISLDNTTNTSTSSSSNSFKLAATNYFISTNFMQAVTMYIGVPCGTAPGNYIVYFSLQQIDSNVAAPGSFAPLPPVQVTVDTSTPATISFGTTYAIYATGSTLLQISISEPNVDPLAVTWAAADNSKNDVTSTLSNVTIPAGTMIAATPSAPNIASPIYSTFAFPGSTITSGPQSFKPASVGTCFSWAQSTVTFTVGGQTAIIAMSSALDTTMFTFKNTDNDSTATAKNTIKFSFQPTKAPGFFYAVLMCNPVPGSSADTLNWPSDADIKKLVVPASNPPKTAFQYYSTYINAKEAPTEFSFTGLDRSKQYAFRFIIESVQAVTTDRTFTAMNLGSLTVPTGTGATKDGATTTAPTTQAATTTQYFQPTRTTGVQCAQFTFASDPGTVTRQAIVNYCQYLFSSAGSAGWYNNGCVVCMDYPTTYNAFGTDWTFDKLFLQCTSTKAKSKLRFLADGTTGDTTGNTATNTNTTTGGTQTGASDNVIPTDVYNSNIILNVCAVPFPICTTDVSQGSKSYADLFAAISNDLKTQEKISSVLGITNAIVSNIATTSDTNAPVVTSLTIAGVKGDLSGNVSWTASSTTPYICYYNVLASSAATPTADAIISCTDKSKCGSVNTVASATIGKVAAPAAMTAGDYKIHFACKNNVPFASQTSAVTSASFKIDAASTGGSTPSTPSSSTANNVVFGWMVAFALLALIFI